MRTKIQKLEYTVKKYKLAGKQDRKDLHEQNLKIQSLAHRLETMRLQKEYYRVKYQEHDRLFFDKSLRGFFTKLFYKIKQ